MTQPILRKVIKKPHPIWTKVILVILRAWLVIYDILAYLPFQFFASPSRKLQRSNRVKAKPVKEKDPSSPWRNVDCPDGKLVVTEFEGCDTLDKLFERAMNEYCSRDCLGFREVLSVDQEKQPNGRVFEKLALGDYHWLTADELNNQSLEVGSGLLQLNHKVNERVVIFAETRYEWMITAIACFRYKFPIITVYPTLGDDAIAHAINEAEGCTVFTTQELMKKTAKLIPHCKTVKRLIYFESRVPDAEEVDESEFTSSLPKGFRIIGYDDLIELGGEGELKNPSEKPKPDDLAVIMYTSGTTGTPKGVLISHKNLVSASAGECPAIRLRDDDTYIAYLPLAHIYELACEIACISHGVRIGYSSPLTLTDNGSKIKKGAKGDAAVLRPTLMATVPSIMDRLFKTVIDKVDQSPAIMRALFEFVYELKRSKIEDGYDTPFLNRLVFNHIRAVLGGRIRIMLSGGAPLNPETQRFMNICFCCPIGQGYGLSETCAAATCCDLEDLKTGNVGPPLMCNEIMLRDWKEGGYSTSNDPHPQGEILISGANVSAGYLNNPKKTAEDFIDIKGKTWFCTGDIGQFMPDGNLKIIDRKKDLLKLQHGEYISLNKVESTLLTCNIVDNVCVCGTSDLPSVVALVVPNKKHLEALGKKLNVDTSDFEELRTNKDVVKAVLKQLQDHSKQNKLEKFETVEKVYLVKEVWSVENGLLTEATKLKRKPIEKHYEEVLKELYSK